MVSDQLNDLQQALFDFSKRNRFLHIDPTSLYCFDGAELDLKTLEKLYLKSRFYRSEYGLETALQVAVFIKWSPPTLVGQEENFFYTSPLFYKPCRIKRIRKIETRFEVETSADEYQVNPLLKHYFEKLYGLILPNCFANLDEGIQVVSSFFNTAHEDSIARLDQVKWFDESHAWQLINRQSIGLFNYKKSSLGADYDQIKLTPNNAVFDLLGERGVEPLIDDPIDFQAISFIDASQRKAIQGALAGNLVIQGPPGTGKSHTIVGLMAAFLSQGKKVLFVSEKKSALDVVAKRLNHLGLGELVAYFNTGKNQKKVFYSQLLRVWEKLNRPDFIDHTRSISNGDQAKDILAIYPTKLLKYRESIDTNLSALIDQLFSSGWHSSELQLSGHLPDLKSWREALPFLHEFETALLPVFVENAIGKLIFTSLNPALFSEQNVIVTLEKRLLDLRLNLQVIQRIQEEYGLKGGIDDFTRLAITGSVLNMVDKVQMDLINADSKKYKSFNSAAKKYDLLKSRLQQARKANDKWSNKPSMSEINELFDLLNQSERRANASSLFRRLKRNPNKLKTAFSDFHSGITDHTKRKLLEGLKLEFRLEGEFEELKVKLKHEYNIGDPEREIDLIFKLRTKLSAVSENDYLFILEHTKGQDLILELSSVHPEIVKFNAQCRYLFQLDFARTIDEFDGFISRLIGYLPQFNHWLNELKIYFNLAPVIRQFLVQNQWPIIRLDAALAYASLMSETRFEPHFNRLSGAYLTDLCDRKRLIEKEQQLAEVLKITNEISRIHQENEQLLTRANFKLTTEQKGRKARYKSAKRIILHEINKQQRHLSIKSFFENTGEFLTEIQPVWMMNPLTVSEFLPCQPDLFDLIIFDESSQIPLEDGIPAIYRAKQVVVVGDSKQMPPSRFFSSREETLTVLDQAEMSLQSHLLRWHYRSKHPDLIRFSNLEFYHGELVCLPPLNTNSPFEYHFVEGSYAQGENRMEAEAVAKYVANLVGKTEKKVLVMAFSQSQENAIRLCLRKLNAEIHPLLQIRNLENAQGIEADYVVVSFGYAKDNEGYFRLNFGPINQVNGANRLNVFFTRAIEKMIVFTSVKSADFGLSENRGVQLLKDFLSYVEQYNCIDSHYKANKAQEWIQSVLKGNGIDFRFYPVGQGLGVSAFVQPKMNRILLLDPGMENPEVIDVSSLYIALSSQFNEVRFMLTYDIWQNPERAKSDLITFFME